MYIFNLKGFDWFINNTYYFFSLRIGGIKIKNFFILSDALNYIEDNLCEPITQEDTAAFCYCSLSSLQKLFRYAFHTSIGDYITKRRMTCSARELLSTSDNITDIGLKYCYNSPEAFCRAFYRIWNITPSEFRRTRRFCDIYPKIELNLGGHYNMKKVDVSELYDLLLQMSGSYIVCFDIIHMMEINKISREHGDLAILECLRRIEKSAGEDMFMFRIGGDEFSLVTALNNKEDVNIAVNPILSQNGNTITLKDISVPVSMRAAALMLDVKKIRYSELFANLQNALVEARENYIDNKIYFIN